MSKVHVIIVNYNTASLLLNCLRSLKIEIDCNANYYVTVLDNASTDNSIQEIETFLRENDSASWLNLIKSEKNLGFAGGNNVAIRKILDSTSPPDYIYLLNPDTTCFKGAITELANFLDTHADVGIVGGRSENLDHSVQATAFRSHSILSELDGVVRLGLLSNLLKNKIVAIPPKNLPHACDWVSGCSLMARTELFKRCGLMDENYFLYYEEVDFCISVKRAGWQIWHVPNSRIVHLEGQSTEVNKKNSIPKRRSDYWFRSRNYFFCKNYGRAYALTANLVWIFGYGIWKLRKLVERKTDNDPPFFYWDFIRHTFEPIHIKLP